MNRVSAARMAVPLLAAALLAGAPLALAQDQTSRDEVTSKSAAWLGITMQDVDQAMAAALGLEKAEGVLVSTVFEDSPAEEAGLQPGDVILSFAGDRVEDAADLVRLVRSSEPGQKVDLEIRRDGKNRTVSVELAERQDKEIARIERVPRPPRQGSGRDFHVYRSPDLEGALAPLMGNHGWLDVKLEDLTEQLGEYFKVENGRGALVSEVMEDGPAAEAGLKAGDVIVGLGDKEVDSVSDLRRLLRKTEPEDEVALQIVRDGKERSLSVKLGERPEGSGWWVGEGRELRMPGLEKLRELPNLSERKDLQELLEQREQLQHERQEQKQELENLKNQLESLRDELMDLKRELKQNEHIERG
jgi:serine protease Do